MRGRITLTVIGQADKPNVIKMIRDTTYLTLRECKQVADALFDEGPQIISMRPDIVDIEYLRNHVHSFNHNYDFFDLFHLDVIDENFNVIQHIHSETFTITSIIDLRKMMKHSINVLLNDSEAPEVLQAAVILFNTLNKNLNKRHIFEYTFAGDQ